MARSTFKVLFYVNGSKERNGIVPIMGRVTINGTVAQFSCKQSVPKTLWDIKGNRAKGKSKEARDINLALDNIKAQIIKHYQRISDREAFVTAEMVRNAYQGIGSEYETLLKAFDRENEVFKKRVGKDRVMATYRSRVVARNHVAAFIKSFYRRTDMSMLEITPDFIKEFAAYLSTEAGLRNGTIWEKCMWLKGVVMRAHFNGLIPRNPFAQFHISPNVKEREYLTEDELKALMTHEFGDWKIQCKLPPKTKRFCPLKTFNNAPLKSLDRWGYYYFSLFPSVCSHFTDTFSCQLNPVRRMYNTIHNGICYCRVSDCIIPIVRWQLRGDDDGLAPMSVLYYIEQDGSFLGIKVHKEEVIQYEQRAPFDSLEFRFQCAFYFCHLKRTHKFRSIRIICPYALLAGFIPHCCGKEALPGTG